MERGSSISRGELYSQKLDRLLEKLSADLGFTPQPYNVPSYSFIAVKNIEEYKHFNCPHYERCLYLACLQNWNDFSCRSCPVWQAKNTKHRITRKVEPLHFFRFVRRVKFVRRVQTEQTGRRYEQLRLL